MLSSPAARRRGYERPEVYLYKIVRKTEKFRLHYVKGRGKAKDGKQNLADAQGH